MRMEPKKAEEILIADQKEQAAPKLQGWHATARMGFAPEMVRVPYIVRIEESATIIIGINFLAEQLPTGHTYTTGSGAVAQIIEAL
jgi:hypothetical protein